MSFAASFSSIPPFLQDYDFCLSWAIQVDLTLTKAETIIKSFNMMKTTRDRISMLSHHILKSFFLWFLHHKYPKYILDAKQELEIAVKVMKVWEAELKMADTPGFYQDYLDGVDYVITGMKILLDPEEFGELNEDNEENNKPPTGRTLAGVLHVKQEFFRPFVDEFDRRAAILEEIRKLNQKDSRACLYLAKTLGQKRKMENYLSAPSIQEMDLLAEGNKTARSKDLSILIELCYCLAQFIKNTKNVRYPVRFHKNTMTFRNEKAIADFINKQTSKMWKEAHDAAPLYVKLAEIQSSLLPIQYRHPQISALALVNRALEKYKKYSKALHRKAKILFKLRQYEEGITCLKAAFTHGETNCDALCDLVFRLMRYPNQDELSPIFSKYCTHHGEDLWGRRKVGTVYYLCGCYLWMLQLKERAVWYWLQAEKRNPNPTFYFENLHKHKSNYKWHQGQRLEYGDIIRFLRCVDPPKEDDRYARDCLMTKLASLMDN